MWETKAGQRLVVAFRIVNSALSSYVTDKRSNIKIPFPRNKRTLYSYKPDYSLPVGDLSSATSELKGTNCSIVSANLYLHYLVGAQNILPETDTEQQPNRKVPCYQVHDPIVGPSTRTPTTTRLPSVSASAQRFRQVLPKPDFTRSEDNVLGIVTPTEARAVGKQTPPTHQPPGGHAVIPQHKSRAERCDSS